MLLLLDNFDSFTYNLRDYFQQLGQEVLVLRNDVPLAEIQKHQFEGIILSPGPGKPKEAGVLMEVIQHYHNKLPILGICLGHQALGEFYGAKLQKATKPMHGKISEISCLNESLFQNLPGNMPVTRYHSLLLTELPETLKPLAQTKQGELMAFCHVEHPVWAVQFHPEALLTTYGLDILRNWLSIAKIVG
ncbi:anthranilate synthase component II [Adhaeribacter soli]|uniref:Aminodeoxychorismate/anthranilate synthase component II n=1 Tax=Adhaeribacter soli TaxID=2607655 RepID=A0A5N1IIK1_9BACT|nr:aminodeoxychorismate/anthranilate synthase component II [Adhaeribacter soli]KAA9325462.1 aminodeoxychorismate/anthranilate synthase component II [Adhaeribacter soli]